MRAGKLRTLLTIEQRTDTPDGMGGVTSTWSTVVQVYGRQLIRAADWSSMEKTAADQVESYRRTRWETRFVTGIKPKMRLKTPADEYYQIEAVYDPSQKGERLEIVAFQRQNGGS
jgi:head-tail adaptor